MPERWPRTVAEAEALRERLVLDEPGPAVIRTAAGVDVAYDKSSDRLAAAVVVLDVSSL